MYICKGDEGFKRNNKIFNKTPKIKKKKRKKDEIFHIDVKELFLPSDHHIECRKTLLSLGEAPFEY